MYAHGVDVFDAADHDTIVGAVPDNLELILFPTQDRLVNLNLPDTRG